MNTELYYDTLLAENCQEVEVTDGANGYPENLQKAVIGFSDFEEAEEFAAKVEGEIVMLHKRDGWQFWEGQGKEIEPIQVYKKDFGDDFNKYFPTITESEFAEWTASFLSENYAESLEDMKKYLDERIELWEKIQDLEDDEFLVAENDTVVFDTYKCEAMHFYYDTHHYEIGVM